MSNGKNINPTELEEKILVSDLVKDCGVFFREGQLNVVILPEDPSTTQEQLREQVIEPLNQSVSSYKRIFQLFVTNSELPRTRLGKLQRFKLSAFALDNEVDEVQEGPEQELSEEFRIIADFIEVEKGKGTPNAPPRTRRRWILLDRVGLQVYIKQSFGVDIEASELSNFPTEKALADYVAEKKTHMEDIKNQLTISCAKRCTLKCPFRSTTDS